MGINKFLFLVIIFIALFLIVDKEQLVKKVKNIEKPKVSFYDSTMYDITQKSVTQIVKSKQADVYDKREELYNATIITKANENSYDTNILSGNSMIKKNTDIYLRGSVNLQTPNGTNLQTEELDYNTQTQIAKNNIYFIATRNADTFEGTNLYLDSLKEEITAKTTKFRMKVTNE